MRSLFGRLLLTSLLVLAASESSYAGTIRYDVAPGPGYTVDNHQGIVKLEYTTCVTAGTTNIVNFKLTVTPESSGTAVFKVMKLAGANASASFDPSTVVLNAHTQQSIDVKLSYVVTQADSRGSKFRFKLDPENGAGLGEGPGVMVKLPCVLAQPSENPCIPKDQANDLNEKQKHSGKHRRLNHKNGHAAHYGSDDEKGDHRRGKHDKDPGEGKREGDQNEQTSSPSAPSEPNSSNPQSNSPKDHQIPTPDDGVSIQSEGEEIDGDHHKKPIICREGETPRQPTPGVIPPISSPETKEPCPNISIAPVKLVVGEQITIVVTVTVNGTQIEGATVLVTTPTGTTVTGTTGANGQVSIPVKPSDTGSTFVQTDAGSGADKIKVSPRKHVQRRVSPSFTG